METDTVDTVDTEEEIVPIVIAKKREPNHGSAPSKVDDANAAEIARLSAWATGDCGKPILAD
jgi:hypothetical protein